MSDRAEILIKSIGELLTEHVKDKPIFQATLYLTGEDLDTLQASEKSNNYIDWNYSRQVGYIAMIWATPIHYKMPMENITEKGSFLSVIPRGHTSQTIYPLIDE